jgi:hypothetical protein
MATRFDSRLHIFRAISRGLSSVDYRAGHELETARFNLFAAIDQNDWADALLWLSAFEVSLRNELAVQDPAQSLEIGLKTVGELRVELTILANGGEV